MKVIDLIKKINDYKLYIEIRDKQFTHYGFYNKDEIKQSKYIKDTIDNINMQYVDNKRVLVITIK